MSTRTIYLFDDLGNKVPIGSYEVLTLKSVGGTIFYIDSTGDGNYTFYNAQGTQVAAPTVGTDCTGWTYNVIGATKDKYYVYNPSAMFKRDRTGTQLDPFMSWTYLDENNQSYIDNTVYENILELPEGTESYEYLGYYGRVYEAISSSLTGTAIGAGKSNTSNMLSIRDGVYNQSSQVRYRGNSEYAETIWYTCDQFNKGTYTLNGNSVVNSTDCNDWYIPSKDELEIMKNYIGATNFIDLLYSGNPEVTNFGLLLWSSSNKSWKYAWRWRLNRNMANTGYTDSGMEDTNKYAGNAACLALCRSF